ERWARRAPSVKVPCSAMSRKWRSSSSMRDVFAHLRRLWASSEQSIGLVGWGGLHWPFPGGEFREGRTLLLLPLLGLIAGVLTTIAGTGGGIILALTMSLAMPPALALAVSAPALLLGNLHRAWVHRAEVDRRVAPAVAGGALLGSLAGGFA